MPDVASACACGGVVSPDVDARVADEMALVTTDGTVETIVMRLNLESTADNAALVIPTPTPATVTAAGPEFFAELATASAPRIETVQHWTWGDGAALDEAAGGAPTGMGAGPTVVRRVQVGPLEATTLAGGGVTGVRDWLQANGYALRAEIAAGLDPYLREGWAVVAMRLTGPAPLNGDLDPVKLVFGSDRLVYPMRMSAQASGPQRVVIYTLGQHRMQRGDADAAAQPVQIDYAGHLAGRTADPTLVELSGNGDYLTRTSVLIGEPATITSDFEFIPALDDTPFQRLLYRHEYRDVTPYVVIGGAAAVGLLGIVVIFAILLGRRRGMRATACPVG